MIPNNTVVRTSIRDDYLHHDKQEYQPLTSTIRGGFDIRDPVLGLDAHDWTLWFDLELRIFNLDKEENNIMSLGSPPYGRVPTELSFAFDEEMRFYWAYSYLDTEGEFNEKRIEFNWYHPEQNMTIKLTLDDVYSVKVVLDDRRQSLIDTNDILLVYVRASDRVVCVRYQRELFQTEHTLFLLRTGESLIRCDVTVNHQLQFEIGKLQQPFTWVKMLDTEGSPVYNHKGHPIWVLENQMADTYSSRPSLSDLSYHRTITGSESFIISDKGEEKQATLNSVFGYLRDTLTLDAYYTKTDANNKFAYMTDVYNISKSHELFETRGHAYSRYESDTRYALKDTHYTKPEIDAQYIKRADVYDRQLADVTFATKTSVYTTSETDMLFALKTDITQPVIDFTPYLTREDAALFYASVNGVYTPTHIDQTFATIASLSSFYTKQKVDEMFAVKEHTVEVQRDNLIRNGVGEYGNNVGWHPSLEYVSYLAPTSPYGAMVFQGPCQRLVLDQTIPVMVNKTYQLSYEYRYIRKVTPGIDLKITFLCLDRDLNIITGLHHGAELLSGARLVWPLTPGDTQMRIDGLEGWRAVDPGDNGFGNIMFYNYKDKGGYMYQDATIPYTRNIAYGEYIPFKENENAASDVHLNPAIGAVIFSKPWDYPNPNREDGVYPIGTRVTRSKPYAGSDELEFRFMDAVGKQYDSAATHVLTGQTEFVTTYNRTGAYKFRSLPPGTVYLRPVLYPNYNYLMDKTEYGLPSANAPAASTQDIVAISQLHLKVDF